ncbi:MAG TPA: acyl-CoA thioesterase [Deltaproteobacteria bacterium]|nr:acyl-CoA thioesterase [Deltaproteobacteria bacterium]HIJ36684.1 acyl-CoA thioesterase [Deltaproteobacteria bacterium]
MKRSNENKTCEVHLTVPFHDLDPMHIVWHGNYMKYFDVARFALFDRCGIDLYEYSKDSLIIFPIIKTNTKHIMALRNKDKFIVQATVLEVKAKIVIDFQIRRSETGVICTKGRSEQVAVKLPEMEMLFEIPDDIRRALGFLP